MQRFATRRWRKPVLAIILLALVGTGVFVYQLSKADELSAQPVFPSPGAADVAERAQVVASFSRPLERSHAEALDVRVRADDGGDVVGAVVFSNDLTSVMFQPLDRYAPGTYHVEIGLDDEATAEEPIASWSFTVPDMAQLAEGPGGPILLVLSTTDVTDETYAEILRTEGLNAFTTVASTELTPELLGAHRVVILADAQLTGAVDIHALTDWVNGGGDVIAIRPDGAVAELAGISNSGSTVEEGYFAIDTSHAPGVGLTAETMQLHGSAHIADLHDGTRALATLLSEADGLDVGPAVTLRDVGDAGGSVATYTYDLAHTVVLTRQGAPELAGQERDGFELIRPSDMFVDSYRDLTKISIPQADEHMRLFANLLGHMSREDGPLPRLWYFPRGAKAVLVMTADDHGTKTGTSDSFDRMLALSPDGCEVTHWECPRATSWMYPTSGLSNDEAANYADDGFDIGAHVTTHCNNWTEPSLDAAFRNDLVLFRTAFPSLLSQSGHRLHCVAWSAYTKQPVVARHWGIRFDMNYYYWPADWADGHAGFMTGSGLPMRFNDPAVGLIDVFQQESHLVNETFGAAAEPIVESLERALGPEGYYGAFGTHYDFSDDFDKKLMDVAIEHNVPMVSAQQMLDWIDTRNASLITEHAWDADTLTFELTVDPHAESMLWTMVPVDSVGGELHDIKGPAGSVSYTIELIKGVEYAMFSGVSGAYSATYAPGPK